MDQIGSRIKHITNELKDYVETRLELMVLNIGDKTTWWIGQSVQKLFGFAIAGLGLVFACTALAIYLGDVLDNEPLGYVIVSVPLFIIGLFFIWAKPKSIAKKIQNQMMMEIMDCLKEKEEHIKTLPSHETEDEIQENGRHQA